MGTDTRDIQADQDPVVMLSYSVTIRKLFNMSPFLDCASLAGRDLVCVVLSTVLDIL